MQANIYFCGKYAQNTAKPVNLPTILGLTFSPVKGPEGNIEFLAHLTLDDKPGIEPDTAQVVAGAHENLKA